MDQKQRQKQRQMSGSSCAQTKDGLTLVDRHAANFATIWELNAETFPDQIALIGASGRRTWSAFEDRAARLASAFASAGIEPGENVGICLYNSNEYTETQFALFKQRAAPFNINYRYRTAELDALLDNADAGAIVFDATVADELEPIADSLVNRCKLMVQVGGETRPWAVDYETLVATNEPAPPIERSANDLWILFTGGTTGHPKGVMWPHSSILGLMYRTYDLHGLTVPDNAPDFIETGRALRKMEGTTIQLAAAPLMHGTSGLIALQTLTNAGTIVTLESKSFDAAEMWRTVDAEGVTIMSIVGDAFARPMLDELDAAAKSGSPYNGSSVKRIASSGVMWSAEVKEGLLRHLDAIMADLLGSSEGAGIASKVTTRHVEATTARFALSDVAQVFDDNDQPVVAGSGNVGHVAVGGPLPLGYYGDPEKSARTWRVIGGKRWCLAGDMATVEADGSIILLGRGSNCINTGGEKVFPEEVEEALKLHPHVHDASAVGIADERWGQRVTAVVAVDPAASLASGDLIEFAKQHLAGYKAPKQVMLVDELQRKPNGKPDYVWARQMLER